MIFLYDRNLFKVILPSIILLRIVVCFGRNSKLGLFYFRLCYVVSLFFCPFVPCGGVYCFAVTHSQDVPVSGELKILDKGFPRQNFYVRFGKCIFYNFPITLSCLLLCGLVDRSFVFRNSLSTSFYGFCVLGKFFHTSPCVLLF